MKAIETTYKGVRFRSRLEVRWAVFFDELGIKWEYEPDGYELSDGTRYLPDFRVIGMAATDAMTFVEVKPGSGARGIRKALQFMTEAYRDHGYHTFIVRGPPTTDGYNPYPFTFSDKAFAAAVAKARAYRAWNPRAGH